MVRLEADVPPSFAIVHDDTDILIENISFPWMLGKSLPQQLHVLDEPSLRQTHSPRHVRGGEQGTVPPTRPGSSSQQQQRSLQALLC